MKILALALTALLATSSYNRSDWISKSQWTKTRAHILQRDQVNGHWICKYSGTIVENKSQIDIDHVIPLSYANDHGGDAFSSTKKHQFANDDSNLVSVTAHENRSKGDDGLENYLPRQNQCWYFIHWNYMSRKYGLKIRGKDASILAKGLAQCADK